MRLQNVINPNNMSNSINIMMNKKFIGLLMLFCVLLIFGSCKPHYSSNFSSTQRYADWWSNREVTQTQKVWLHPLGSDLYYNYYVNGVKYSGLMNFSQGSLVYYSENLNYKIYYNSEDPSRHAISMHEPILDEHFEKFNEVTIGLLVNYGKNDFSGAASFRLDTRFFSNPNARRNGLHSLNFRRSYIDTLPYVTHPNHHVYPLKHTFDDPYIFDVEWDKPFSIDATGTRLVTPQANDYPEKKLTEAAQELGDGGVIYWMPREQSLKQASPKMHKFLETYQPKDKDGNVIDVEIVIVDHEFIDELNDNSYNE